MTRYEWEEAKSNRSHCARCQGQIQKGTLRLRKRKDDHGATPGFVSFLCRACGRYEMRRIGNTASAMSNENGTWVSLGL